ncbi:unnamed protein product [Pleuronectes platessa]|uniref:Uncharacterized protein n=1 Tax=Pleuronectes platessa TaxID=8262 RepID=A0A9N7YYX7_PLEPL|nr:unnamed protein product [Pleuronectes platessa]
MTFSGVFVGKQMFQEVRVAQLDPTRVHRHEADEGHGVLLKDTSAAQMFALAGPDLNRKPPPGWKPSTLPPDEDEGISACSRKREDADVQFGI